MQTNDHERRRPAGLRRAAFTMVEMMAVFAVLGVLGAVVATGVIGRMHVANQESERTSLTTLTTGLREHVARSKRLPGPSDLAGCLAGHLWVGVDRVRANTAGRERQFYFDPEFRLGPDGADKPPYVQTSRGSRRPEHARVIIVSSVGDALPGVLLNPATFSNLWSTRSNAIPDGWAGYWCGKGEDLQIARVDLASLFHRVVVENRDPSLEIRYSVETNAPVSVPPGGRQEFWVIDTSSLSFHGPDGAVDSRELVLGNAQYQFENGSWNRPGRQSSESGDGEVRGGLGLARSRGAAPVPE